MRLLLVATALAALATGASHAQNGGDNVLNMGSRLELFVDGYLIDTMAGLTRELHSPEPREVAIVFDKPWEGKATHYVTVFRDGPGYRMYYRGLPLIDFDKEACGPEVICLAESADGVSWTRPNVGLFEANGTGDNNIVWMGAEGPAATIASNFSVFKDPNPACPPDQLYKGVGSYPLYAIASPDGVSWRFLTPDPVITDGAFDTQNIAFYDTFRGEYRAFVRDFANGVRTVRTCTSQDFIHWTTPEWCAYGGTPWEQLYTNATLAYYRAPHIFLSFPKRFVDSRTKHTELPPGFAGVSEGVFMSSRDGLNFDRSFMEAWIRPGLDQDNWWQRTNAPTWGILDTAPGELSVYWLEHYENPTKDCQLRRGTLRTDGFVSMNAPYVGGEFTTKPLTFEGKELVLNYSTSAVGSVQVEVQKADGTPIESFTLRQCPELFGDEIERIVSWEGGSDLSALAGQPVRLRFVMKDADLYSIRFR